MQNNSQSKQSTKHSTQLETLLPDLIKHLMWIRFDLNQIEYARSALDFYAELLKDYVDLKKELRKAIDETRSKS